MFSATAYTFHITNDQHDATLRRIAGLDSQRPLRAPAIVGSISGSPAAAMSLADGRVAADPFVPTAALVTHLRMRARGIEAARRTPSLRERMLAVVRPAARAA